MGPADVERIREQMEEAEARKLQPLEQQRKSLGGQVFDVLGQSDGLVPNNGLMKPQEFSLHRLGRRHNGSRSLPGLSRSSRQP